VRWASQRRNSRKVRWRHAHQNEKSRTLASTRPRTRAIMVHLQLSKPGVLHLGTRKGRPQRRHSTVSGGHAARVRCTIPCGFPAQRRWRDVMLGRQARKMGYSPRLSPQQESFPWVGMRSRPVLVSEQDRHGEPGRHAGIKYRDCLLKAVFMIAQRHPPLLSIFNLSARHLDEHIHGRRRYRGTGAARS